LKFLEVTISAQDQLLREMLIAELAEVSYDSFEERSTQLLAYIDESIYSEDVVTEILSRYQNFGKPALISAELLPDKNWNEEWERNFDPVEIAERIRIRAPFHPSKEDFEYEILLMPKMAFGTGHHATTFQMLEKMLECDFTGSEVLDYGCGTAVLALMAEKRGAKTVLAIDNDDWATRNAKEVLLQNNCRKITVLEGEKELFEGKHFDWVLANINKNVLLDSLVTLANTCKVGGQLLMSGILADDVEEMIEVYSDEFLWKESRLKDNWAVIHFEKK